MCRRSSRCKLAGVFNATEVGGFCFVFFLSLQCFESSSVFMLLECEGCAKADNFLGRTCINLSIVFYKVLKKSYFQGFHVGFQCNGLAEFSVWNDFHIPEKNKPPSFAI